MAPSDLPPTSSPLSPTPESATPPHGAAASHSPAGEPRQPPPGSEEADELFDDDEPAESEGGRPGLLGESVRRVLLGGASALLTTEEGIRSMLAERRLPKEALQALLAQTDKTRREVGRLVGRELKNTLGRVDVAGELRRALSGLRFDISMSIRVHDEERAGTAPAPSSSPAAAGAAEPAAATAATSGGAADGAVPAKPTA